MTSLTKGVITIITSVLIALALGISIDTMMVVTGNRGTSTSEQGTEAKQAAINARTIAEQDPDGVCERTIEEVSVPWAASLSGDVTTRCDYVLDDAQTHPWGYYDVEHNLISVSKKTPEDKMEHVYLHELAHAYMTLTKMETGPNWSEWEKLADEHGGPMVDYYASDAREVLADNTARCELGGKESPLGFAIVPCDDMYALFPQFDTNNETPTT